MSNIVTATFPSGAVRVDAQPFLWQWDYGQILKIRGLELPATCQVHFSNLEVNGFSVTALATNGEVEIPNEVLQSGQPVYAFIYLHTGLTDGETEYRISCYVNRRPQPNDPTPTPAQQSVIDAAIASLTSAVTQTGQDATAAAGSATAAAGSATAAAGSATAAAADAQRIADAGGDIDQLGDGLFDVNAGLSISSYTFGRGIVIATGRNFDSPKYTVTGYYSYSAPYRIWVDSPDYEFIVWTYSAVSVSSAVYSPRQAYSDAPVVILPRGGATRFRLGIRRKDGSDLTTDSSDPTSDAAIIPEKIRVMRVTEEELTDSPAPISASAVTGAVQKLRKALTSYRPVCPGLPFQFVEAHLTTERASYVMQDNAWQAESTMRYATEIIPCPRYLLVRPKSSGVGLFIYIGTMDGAEFVPDTSATFTVTPAGVINYITDGMLTHETDGTKVMWLGVSKSEGLAEYTDAFDLIGADEWPESPFSPNAWNYITGDASNNLSRTSTTDAGYYLPEEAWVFIRGVSRARINYGIGSSASKPWSASRNPVSAFYIPKGAGMPLLTVAQSDSVTKSNVCIVPKILDSVQTGNAIHAKRLADDILEKFRFIGKSAAVNIASNVPITVGKSYHTIPYSSLWQAQHFVCFDTTPETAANAANDEYSVFYDTSDGRSELSNDGAMRPGYGGVCSVFASLACGAPYPQTTDGFFADETFVIGLLGDIHSGDVVLNKTSDDHGVFVDSKLENGYSLFEYAPPGLIESIHTAALPVPVGDIRVSRRYLDDYRFTLHCKDTDGWNSNYLDFNYQIASGSIRPWRGNKSVCSDYNKSAPATTLQKHTGIWITVHDSAATAYLKKPDGTVVSLDVSGQTVVLIDEYVDQVGQYELWSDMSETREYFRYFEHDKVYLHLDDSGTAIFTRDAAGLIPAEDVDYAYVWTYGVPTDYTGVASAAVSVMAAGKKYPGIQFRSGGVKCAVARDTLRYPDYDSSATYSVGDLCLFDKKTWRCVTEIVSPESFKAAHWTRDNSASWGRYPVACEVVSV